MEYTYNLSGAMVEQKYPSGRVVKNVLDDEGRLSLVQSKKNANTGYWNYANSFTYNAAGSVSSMQLGNGKWESTTFNSRLQPKQFALGKTQGAFDLLKLNYTYGTTNNNGNVMTQKITVPNEFTADQTYTYDSLNRLESATETISGSTSWRQTFDYDRYGNRRFNTSGTNTTTIESSCAVAVCNPMVDPATNKLVGYTFDNAGNTKVDANSKTFTYDAENKQTKVVSGGTTVGEYFYDGDGKRVKKIAGTEETIFVYNASGQLVAEYSNQISQTPRVSYLTNDHLGSPRITTDMDGNVFSRRDFMPFGEEITSEHTSQRSVNLNYGEDQIRQKFTSYERDIETELDFAQARMYANKLGRFTTTDPVNTVTPQKLGDVQQQNLYTYARNNPLRFIDPSGMIIKPRNLTDEERSQWDETVRLANLQDEDGNYVHPELHALYAKLDGDSRTFYIDGEDLGKGTAGRFDVETFTADGKDFTEASIKINFGLLNDIRATTTGDFDKSFEKLAGLFGDKDSPIRRIAEIFGHEASHAEFALNNPADAVKLQILINDGRPGGKTFERWKQYSLDKSKIKKRKNREKFLPPPDLVEKQATKDSMLQATEKYAQEREKVFNIELQNSKKK